MERIKFTHHRITKMKNDTGKELNYRDSEQKGLYLRLTPAGGKIFRLEHWSKKRQKTIKLVIGHFPDISLIRARDIAAEYAVAINNGVDLQGIKKKEKLEQVLDNIFEDWLQKHAIPNSKRWKEDKSRYNLYIRPHLGQMKLSEITPDEVRDWQLTISKYKKQRGGGLLSKSTIQRAQIVLSSIFSKAAPQLDNPCSQVETYVPPHRTQFLKTDHLSNFFRALNHPDTPDYLRDYLLLSLYTGARRSNVLSMQWGHIDLNLKLWIIPGSETKNSEPQVVPLLDQAVEILQRRKENRLSVFVLPSPLPPSRRSKTGHLVEPKRAWKSLLKRAGLPTDYRLHDIRRTMGSWQAITGSSTKLIGASLGHKSEQATAHYAHLTIEPIRAAMQKAADEMDKQKDVSKVVQIKTNEN